MTTSDYVAELVQSLEEKAIVLPCGAESLLGLMYDVYFETQGPSSTEIKKDFRSLYSRLEGLDSKKQEMIIELVSTLCMEHERSGFIDGIKIGFTLKKELDQ